MPLILCLLITSITTNLLELGDFLLEEGCFYDAITEYKRHAFFSDSPDAAKVSLIRIGEAYRRMGDIDQAIAYLEKAIPLMKSPDEISSAKLQIGIWSLQVGDLEKAGAIFDDAKYGAPNMEHRLRAQMLLGVTDTLSYRWRSGESKVLETLPEIGVREADLELLKAMYEEAGSGLKSPKLAGFLSAIIPGLGRAYVGEWRSALNAFILNGAILAWAVREFRHDDPFDAVAIMICLFPRYYVGNILRSTVAAANYNDVHLKRQATQILMLVESLLQNSGGTSR